MTGREKLNRRKRWLIGIPVAGIAVFIGGMLVGRQLLVPGLAPQVVMVVSLSGFGVAFLTVMYAHLFGLRCPWCRGNMAPLMLQRSIFDRRVRFCPYCGRELDEELLEYETDDVLSER